MTVRNLALYFMASSLLIGCAGNKWFALSPKHKVVQSTSEKKPESATQVKVVDSSEPQTPQVAEPQKKLVEKKPVILSKQLDAYCDKIDQRFDEYKWGESLCRDYQWNHVRNSIKGDPLIWKVYGNEDDYSETNDKDMTLVMCGVHGDEITPIRFCFDILKHLEANKEEYKDKVIAVAPIVNPDSFFKKRATRTNQRGIDINRNFPTKDWWSKANRIWRDHYRKDPRRYPGKRPNSEPEVVFQVNLIKRYRPDKIISVHAPLTMLDYDGPGETKSNDTNYSMMANQLLISMSKKAAGYRVKNYPYFPGSLGNYAGNERGIPTYTLELPTSDPRYSDHYWKLFKNAIHYAFMTDIKLEPKDLAARKLDK